VVESSQVRWVMLAYRLPREPSTPRITVWRKLKRLGVAQLFNVGGERPKAHACPSAT
jgi:hypothetical protein